MDNEFDFSLAYKADGWGEGIAWRATGYEKIYDEDFWWQGEYEINTERVYAHMIGDDEQYTFDIEDLIPLTDEDYCPECGQIGCKAYQ